LDTITVAELLDEWFAYKTVSSPRKSKPARARAAASVDFPEPQIHVLLPAGTIADLHWHLLNDPASRRAFPADVHDLLKRARTVEIGGQAIQERCVRSRSQVAAISSTPPRGASGHSRTRAARYSAGEPGYSGTT
jgi:hypothetical protein